MDPDHTTGSNWGVKAVDVVLNGANGFAGLTDAAQLFVEYSNETWNSGGSRFSQTFYCAYRGFLRWPTSGPADYASMVSLRSVVAVGDIKKSAHNSSRLKFVLAGQGTYGIAGVNSARIDGTKFFLNDPLNVSGPAVAPMAHHDYFAFASYFVPHTSFDAANLATLTNNWIAAIGDSAEQEAACAAYVKGIVNPALGGNETVDRYRLTLLPAYAAKMKSYDKYAIMYEGGWDHDIKPVHTSYLVTSSIPFASGAMDEKANILTGVSANYVASRPRGILSSDTAFLH